MTHPSGLDINRLERITDHLQRQYIDKGTVHGVYSDQVGEASYQASCFHDGEFGDFSTKTVRSYA